MMKAILPVTKQLKEMTQDELYVNTLAAFPYTTRRQNVASDVTIEQMMYVPYTKSNALMIRSQTSGNETTIHTQAVTIFDVDYEGDQVQVPGHDLVINSVNPEFSDIKVKCTCSDFYWRFATWNAARDALIGDPPAPYTKKSNRPPANPSQLPGLCKHLIAILARATEDRIIE